MRVSKRRGLSPASSFLLAGLLFAASSYGQSVSVVRGNSYEIDPFIGASYGLDSGRVMGGGNVTYGCVSCLRRRNHTDADAHQ
jgi:hypothetical protein